MRDVRAKKALGQHFLTDKGIAQRIADSVSGGVVLEVGCGMGVLTEPLLARKDVELFGIEVDRESIAYLNRYFPQFRNRLTNGDFLGLELDKLYPQGLRIVGNFPYNISSQIFFKVLDYRDLIPEVVGMLQREVALRIAAGTHNRERGILSVLLQAWYDIEYLFGVDEHVFSPPPKVKSAVVRLRRNSVTDLGVDWAMFVKVVKAAFSQRRKMLRNPLRAAFGNFGGGEHPFFTRRAEELSVEEFIELTKWIIQNNSKVIPYYSKIIQNLIE